MKRKAHIGVVALTLTALAALFFFALAHPHSINYAENVTFETVAIQRMASGKWLHATAPRIVRYLPREDRTHTELAVVPAGEITIAADIPATATLASAIVTVHTVHGRRAITHLSIVAAIN